MRIFALSDLHMDFSENFEWLKQLSDTDYKSDALITAGDISHNINELTKVLKILSSKFNRVFFVPGNHDLWMHNSMWKDSLHKFEAVLDTCTELNICCRPAKLGENDRNPVWIVPLFSWYTQPGEGEDSLYWEKPGEDSVNRMWSDNYYIKWPDQFKPAQYFLEMNEEHLQGSFNSRVISFSHFLPRQEVMFSTGIPPSAELIKKYDRRPAFNFSRVAGSSLIEIQLRKIDSFIHIHGHQHLNRDMIIHGVRYISNCFGYPAERRRGQIFNAGLMRIWDTSSEPGSYAGKTE